VRRYRLAPSARRDLVDILAWSEERHGAVARARYERLITTALRKLALDPHRPGARELTSERPGLGWVQDTCKKWSQGLLEG
jgi:toxin ParE1/3/4